jgi:tRNA G26 N,N-dimethylase Trm1
MFCPFADGTPPSLTRTVTATDTNALDSQVPQKTRPKLPAEGEPNTLSELGRRTQYWLQELL